MTPTVQISTTSEVPKRYMRTTEVATQLGVSRQQVLNLRKAGKLRGSKIGSRTILWDPDSVDALIAEGFAVDVPDSEASPESVAS
jgi:excisionase family DNA binding protein